MRQVTHALLTRPPLSQISVRKLQSASFDLHVLSTPPAFILSQDQTLILKCLFPEFSSPAGFWKSILYLVFVLLNLFLESFRVGHAVQLSRFFVSSAYRSQRQLPYNITVILVCQQLFRLFLHFSFERGFCAVWPFFAFKTAKKACLPRSFCALCRFYSINFSAMFRLCFGFREISVWSFRSDTGPFYQVRTGLFSRKPNLSFQNRFSHESKKRHPFPVCR